MTFRDAPLRQKLTLVIMAVSTVVLFLTAGALISYEVYSFHQSLLQNSRTIGDITAEQSSAAVYFEDEKACADVLSKLKAEPTIRRAALYAKDGRLLARYPASEQLTFFPPARGIRGYALAGRSLDIFVPVRQGSKVVGELYLNWDLRPAYRRLARYTELAILVLITTLAIAWGISNWLQRRISKPILELTDAARIVSERHDYTLQAKKHGSDEIGFLTDAFNQMLTQIGGQNEALRRQQEELKKALQAAHASAEEVRALNAELEERVARRTAELEATNRQLEAFTYSVSHDLRAPLRRIDSFAQLLEERGQGDPDEAAQFISRIRASAQNMVRLVDDLLNLSRLGRSGLQLQPVALDTLVKEVLLELRPDTKGREIDWHIDPLPIVQADRGLILQVFMNLISNSVKYTRQRPKAIIEVGSEDGKGAPVFFVRDNGAGFDMKNAGKLFGVFQRLHGGAEFEGNGIGLATVQRIIQLHGGRIWAEAEVDKGATFRFTLGDGESSAPADAKQEKENPPPS